MEESIVYAFNTKLYWKFYANAEILCRWQMHRIFNTKSLTLSTTGRNNSTFVMIREKVCNPNWKLKRKTHTHAKKTTTEHKKNNEHQIIFKNKTKKNHIYFHYHCSDVFFSCWYYKNIHSIKNKIHWVQNNKMNWFNKLNHFEV